MAKRGERYPAKHDENHYVRAKLHKDNMYKKQPDLKKSK